MFQLNDHKEFFDSIRKVLNQNNEYLTKMLLLVLALDALSHQL